MKRLTQKHLKTSDGQDKMRKDGGETIKRKPVR